MNLNIFFLLIDFVNEVAYVDRVLKGLAAADSTGR